MSNQRFGLCGVGLRNKHLAFEVTWKNHFFFLTFHGCESQLSADDSLLCFQRDLMTAAESLFSQAAPGGSV